MKQEVFAILIFGIFVTTVYSSLGETPEKTCGLPPVHGPCWANQRRYFYNEKSGNCELFMYGGCGGNGNNFFSKEKCGEMCNRTKPTIKVFSETCGLPLKKGFCWLYRRRYFYNGTSGNCELFIFEGCGGNGNNFLSKEKCDEMCTRTKPTIKGLKACPMYKCHSGCAMKKLPVEECASCHCDEEPHGASLQKACKDAGGECQSNEDFPQGPQNSFFCKAKETCVYKD